MYSEDSPLKENFRKIQKKKEKKFIQIDGDIKVK